MTHSTITTAVTKAVPGLTVLAEYIHARSVEGTVALIVAELTRKVAA